MTGGGATIVPVHLGCCTDVPGRRCALCAPTTPPTPALVEALVESYRARHPNRPVRVRFLGGPPPPDPLLEVVRGLPIDLRVRPDALSRADARRLAHAGVDAIELDALSFVDRAVRDVGRAHRAALVREQSAGLRGLGMAVGGVLAPGLPGTDYASSVADAEAAAGLWSFVRLHPVQVLAGSALRERHARGSYEALELGEAVTVLRAMLDVLERAGVQVRRVGQQAGPDGLGRAVAGPRHPSLRELVEARRTLDRLRALVAGAAAPGDVVQVCCAPADLGRARGPLSAHIRALRAAFGLAEIRVSADPKLPRGTLRVDVLATRPAPPQPS